MFNIRDLGIFPGINKSTGIDLSKRGTIFGYGLSDDLLRRNPIWEKSVAHVRHAKTKKNICANHLTHQKRLSVKNAVHP